MKDKTPQITPDIIKTLDIIYATGGSRNLGSLDGVLIKGHDSKLETILRPIKDPRIIGAVLAPNPYNGYFPSPVFSDGELNPETINFGERSVKRWRGLHASSIQNRYLTITHQFEGEIDIEENGEGSVYIGLGETIPAIVFAEPLKFDPKKQLTYVRSPNGSRTFKALHTQELRENNLIEKYSLIYEELTNLRTGKFAHNNQGFNYNGRLSYE